MKSKASRYVFVGIALLLVALIAVAVNAASRRPSSTPPPPPTPGPPPPLPLDRVQEGGKPITNRTEAIQHALSLDSWWAVREQPLTEEMIAANPDMIVVEPYATRQEASNVYFGDVFGIPEVASEPVWVVIIKGKVSIKNMGIAARSKEYEEADGVTYVISQKTGNLLSITSRIVQKRTDNSP